LFDGDRLCEVACEPISRPAGRIKHLTHGSELDP
jgi:hypothetical protein